MPGRNMGGVLMTESPTSLAEMIKRALGNRSQGELARALGVSQSTVSRWISGAKAPSHDRLTDIEEALDMPVGQLRRAAGLAVGHDVDIIATGPDRAVWLIEVKGEKAAIDERSVEAQLTAYARERGLVIDSASDGGAWRRYTMDRVDELVADIATDEIRPLLAAAADQVEGPATFFVLVTRRMDDIVAESKLATLRQWQEDRGLSIEDLDRLIEVLRLTGGKRPDES